MFQHSFFSWLLENKKMKFLLTDAKIGGTFDAEQQAQGLCLKRFVYLRRLFFMKLVIGGSMAVSGSSLHLKVAGFSIEVSDISISEKVAVIEESGRISVEVVPFVEVSQALLKEVQEEQEEPSKEVVPEVAEVAEVAKDSPDMLFQRLVALRKQIAKEVKLPPYIIFHDTSLKDMVSKMPTDLEEMKEISGVGEAKLEKYGKRFVEAILKHISESEAVKS
jgi:superfamily II DNA helicase RecQ